MVALEAALVARERAAGRPSGRAPGGRRRRPGARAGAGRRPGTARRRGTPARGRRAARQLVPRRSRARRRAGTCRAPSPAGCWRRWSSSGGHSTSRWSVTWTSIWPWSAVTSSGVSTFASASSARRISASNSGFDGPCRWPIGVDPVPVQAREAGRVAQPRRALLDRREAAHPRARQRDRAVLAVRDRLRLQHGRGHALEEPRRRQHVGAGRSCSGGSSSRAGRNGSGRITASIDGSYTRHSYSPCSSTGSPRVERGQMRGGRRRELRGAPSRSPAGAGTDGRRGAARTPSRTRRAARPRSARARSPASRSDRAVRRSPSRRHHITRASSVSVPIAARRSACSRYSVSVAARARGRRRVAPRAGRCRPDRTRG